MKDWGGRSWHLALLAIALAGLLAGGAAAWTGPENAAGWIWSAATVPVVAGLAIAILRDFLAGRVGVDAIALVAMAAALALGEPLAAIVVAIMYSGGNVLEDYARSRAEFNLKALTDCTPRVAHRFEKEGLADVPVSEVVVDNVLLVKAGEVIPVDGTLLGVARRKSTSRPSPANRSRCAGFRARFCAAEP